MNLTGVKVRHTVFRDGTVVAHVDNHITVAFATKTSVFTYPDAFEKFLKADDPDLQKQIEEAIKAAKHTAEEERLAKEAAYKAEAERKAQETVKKEPSARVSKQHVSLARIEGKPMTFFVFQGSTFDKEYQGGYIWAPLSDKSGYYPHHWERLRDVREGDIILHGYNACVQAISVAKGAAYVSPQPVDLTTEDLWEKDGLRVDCEYTYINKPIKTFTYVDDILRLCNVKYAPFDKDGRGNMGYLFDLNRELAHIFINASVKANPELSSQDFIRDFLSSNND